MVLKEPSDAGFDLALVTLLVLSHSFTVFDSLHFSKVKGARVLPVQGISLRISPKE